MSRRDTKLDRVVGKAGDVVAGAIANIILASVGTLAVVGLLGKLLTLVCLILGEL
jgi:hypothetical protein